MSCYCVGMKLDRGAVKLLCIEKGWEVADLARHSRVPIASLYKYLNRRRPTSPPAERVLAIAGALDVQVDQVVRAEEMCSA